jgi:hypothetical protein
MLQAFDPTPLQSLPVLKTAARKNGGLLRFLQQPDRCYLTPVASPLGSWRATSSISAPRSNLAAVALQDRIYALGGQGDGGPLDLVKIYDPGTDEWVTSSPVPSRARCITAAALGGRIYAFGGGSEGHSHEWNPGLDLHHMTGYHLEAVDALPIKHTQVPNSYLKNARMKSHLSAVLRSVCQELAPS